MVVIAIGGRHGAGRSTIAKLLAKKLNLKHVSTGDLFRELAEERGMSVEEFNKYAETHPEIDKEIDKRQVEYAKKGNAVLESNLAAHLVRDADLKVWLQASEHVRAKRILNAKKGERGAEKGYASELDVIKQLNMREESEKKRYLKIYGIDPFDLGSYNLVISTDRMTPDEIVDKIISYVKK